MATNTDHNVFTWDGEEHEVFMAYALLSDLSSIVQSPENIAEILQVPELTDTLVSIVITPRTKTGKISTEDGKLIPLSDLDITDETVFEILTWALDHVMDFLLRKGEMMTKLAQKYHTRGLSLKSSMDGLANSVSKTE